MKQRHVLIAEDSKSDLFLIQEAIVDMKIEAVLHVVRDGEQAIQFIRAAETCPDLVLLDLNLPKRDGVEVLRFMRNSETCKGAPVLVVTSSDSPSDREAVKALGYNAYFRKPSAYEEFMKLGSIVKGLLEG